MAGAPPAYRGGALAAWDDEVCRALRDLQGRMDLSGVALLWQECLDAPAWADPPAWAHSDVMPGNLVVQDGRLVGVLDFEASGIGDPACDLMVAWNLMNDAGRRSLRDELGVDDATWCRGQGSDSCTSLSRFAVLLAHKSCNGLDSSVCARSAVTEARAF